jgi:Domain of unknown function (DUF4326)
VNLFGHTTVVALEDASPDAIYIGRAGRGQDGTYGNPYTVEEWGEQALVMFDVYLNDRCEKDAAFRAKVFELDGKELACPGNCKKRGNKKCHGDSYVRWLDEHRHERKRV